MKRIDIIVKTILILAAIGGNAYGQAVKHHAFTVYFNAKNKCPDSVSWNLTPQMLKCGKVKRVDKFAKDPLLAVSPAPKDFVQLPGYKTNKTIELAKGHLFSYEDAMCNPADNTECFYVDQMYSQYQQFNAGDWKTVEAYERILANKAPIHVIAGYIGPITQHLSTGLPIVPYMYKAIYSCGKWIAWIMPNLPSTKGHKFAFWEVPASVLASKTGLKLH